MPASSQIDTRIEIVTPENIAFEYRLAGPFRRLAAYAVDVLVIGGIGLGSLTLFGLLGATVGLGEVGVGFWLALMFVLLWFYFGLLETFWNGQTIGKRAMRLRVVSITGQPITALQAVLRNILRAADAAPTLGPGAEFSIPLYQAGLVVSASNARFQRIGDLFAGTMVICEDRHAFGDLPQITESGALQLAEVLPADFVVPPRLARTLSMYVQRRRAFHPARRREISQHLGKPLAERFGLPRDTDPDLLLCALYHRTFFPDQVGAPDAPPGSFPNVQYQGVYPPPLPSEFPQRR